MTECIECGKFFHTGDQNLTCGPTCRDARTMRVNDDRAKRLRLAQNREFTDSVTMPENRLETVGRGISKILEDGKSGLTETEIAIIKARVFEETPLKTLSERFGKSKAGIAYIFDYGLRKIRIRFWDELDISDYR